MIVIPTRRKRARALGSPFTPAFGVNGQSARVGRRDLVLISGVHEHVPPCHPDRPRATLSLRRGVSGSGRPMYLKKQHTYKFLPSRGGAAIHSALNPHTFVILTDHERP